MYQNIQKKFVELNLTNHSVIIIQQQVNIDFLKCDNYKEQYMNIIASMLQRQNIQVDLQSAFIYRPPQDTFITQTLLQSYILQLDSDNWMSVKQLADVISSSMVKRSDENAIIIYCDSVYNQDQLFTTYNFDSNEISIFIVQLSD